MKQILLATSNSRKLGEARAGCKDFDIDVIQVKLDIEEIQNHDPRKIAEHKALRAFEATAKPITITDTSWSIPALNGFPGGYMKDVSSWFTPEDFLNLLANKKDRRINFTETIVYKDIEQMKVFSQQYWGRIADTPRGQSGAIDQVAEFDGLTLAESQNMGKHSHDPKDYIWYQFARWFTGLAKASAL
jgi:XTP/dITP diphosphohydrolase